MLSERCTVLAGADDEERTISVLSVQRLHTAEPRPSVAPRGSRRVMFESLFLLLLKLWPMVCFDLPHFAHLPRSPRGSHTCRLPSVTQNHFFFLRDLLHYPRKADYADKSILGYSGTFPNTNTLFKPEAYSLFPVGFDFFSPTTHSQTNGDARDTREGVVHRNRNIAPTHASNFQQSKAGYFHHTLTLRFRRESVIIIIYHEKGTTTTTTKTRGTTRNCFFFRWDRCCCFGLVLFCCCSWLILSLVGMKRNRYRKQERFIRHLCVRGMGVGHGQLGTAAVVYVCVGNSKMFVLIRLCSNKQPLKVPLTFCNLAFYTFTVEIINLRITLISDLTFRAVRAFPTRWR